MGSFLLGELMWWLDACLEEGRRVGKVGIFRVVHRLGGGMGVSSHACKSWAALRQRCH